MTAHPADTAIHRHTDAEAMAEAVAERFASIARQAVDAEGRCIVVLSGGTTPRRLYSVLGGSPYRDTVPWSQTVLLFGDERCVPDDDEQSNYRMVRETLIEPLEIDAKQVYRMEGERPPVEAATRYQLRIRDLYPAVLAPHFDLVLLGVGEDGHTASLFPGSEALTDRRRWVAANRKSEADAWRLTMTLPALNAARNVFFLAAGRNKSSVVAEIFGDRPHETTLPAELVVPDNGTREVFLDDEAAAGLPALS